MSPSTKKNIAGFIILLLVGAGVLYYSSHSTPENRSPSDSLLINDSTAHVGEVTAPGAKPEVNPQDGSVKLVEEFIKANAKNPSTIQFLEWSALSTEGGYWKVRCKYVGVSSFNAEVTTNAWFYIQNNNVVREKIISKI
jgi:hypothetical protein